MNKGFNKMNKRDRLTTDEMTYVKMLWNVGNRNNFIGLYDEKQKKDISIESLVRKMDFTDYLDNRYDFFMTINPHYSKGLKTLKEQFNYIKNQYLEYRYGKEYPTLAKEEYDIVFEEEDVEDDTSYKQYEYFEKKKYHKILNNHIHLVWSNITIPEIWEIQAFFFHLFKKEYKKTTIYTKICNKEDTILYMLKKKDTFLYTQNDFKQ